MNFARLEYMLEARVFLATRRCRRCGYLLAVVTRRLRNSALSSCTAGRSNGSHGASVRAEARRVDRRAATLSVSKFARAWRVR